jgi:hypothetical protein
MVAGKISFKRGGIYFEERGMIKRIVFLKNLTLM